MGSGLDFDNCRAYPAAPRARPLRVPERHGASRVTDGEIPRAHRQPCWLTLDAVLQQVAPVLWGPGGGPGAAGAPAERGAASGAVRVAPLGGAGLSGDCGPDVTKTETGSGLARGK